MKALTIYQPYADLIALSAKRYETRSWATNHRGPTAIHAGAKSFQQFMREAFPYLVNGWSYHPNYAAGLAFLEQLAAVYYDTPFTKTNPMSFVRRLELLLPRGAVIATANLVDCHSIHLDPKTHRIRLVSSRGMQGGVSGCSPEAFFGDYRPGRYAWEWADVQPLPEPVPCRGQQGLWNWKGVTRPC